MAAWAFSESAAGSIGPPISSSRLGDLAATFFVILGGGLAAPDLGIIPQGLEAFFDTAKQQHKYAPKDETLCTFASAALLVVQMSCLLDSSGGFGGLRHGWEKDRVFS